VRLVLIVCIAVANTETFLQAPIIEVSTCAGSGTYGGADGKWDAAQFDTPHSLSVSPDGEWLAVAGYQNGVIRYINLTARTVTSLAGGSGNLGGSVDGVGSNAKFVYPRGVAVSPDGAWVAVADSFHGLIRKVDVASRAVSTVSGTTKGYQDGAASEARFNAPFSLAFDPTGTFLVVADSGNHVIRRVEVATGAVSTVAGLSGSQGLVDGAGGDARFRDPRGVSVSPDGSWVAVADTGNNAVRRVVLWSGQVSLVAGGKTFSDYVDDIGTMARFDAPADLSISPDGGVILVADSDNNRIRLVEWSIQKVSTLAGNGTLDPVDGPLGNMSGFRQPQGVAFGRSGSWAAVSDTGNHLIRNISIPSPPIFTPPPNPYAEFSSVLNLSSTSSSAPRLGTGGGGAPWALPVLLSLLAAWLDWGGRVP